MILLNPPNFTSVFPHLSGKMFIFAIAVTSFLY